MNRKGIFMAKFNFLGLFGERKNNNLEINQDEEIIQDLLKNNLNLDTLKKIHTKGHELSYMDYAKMTNNNKIRVLNLMHENIFQPENYPIAYFKELFLPVSKNLKNIEKLEVKNLLDVKSYHLLEKFKENPYDLNSIKLQQDLYIGFNMYLMEACEVIFKHHGKDPYIPRFLELIKNDHVLSKYPKISQYISKDKREISKSLILGYTNSYEESSRLYLFENVSFIYKLMEVVSFEYKIKLINVEIIDEIFKSLKENLIGTVDTLKNCNTERLKVIDNLFSPIETEDKLKELSDKVIEYKEENKNQINLFNFNENLKKKMQEIDELFDKLRKSTTLQSQEIFYINHYNKTLEDVMNCVKKIDIKMIQEIKEDKKNIVDVIDENLFEIKEGLKIIHLTDQKRILNDLKTSQIYLSGLKLRI